jgi:hypothetical protein
MEDYTMINFKQLLLAGLLLGCVVEANAMLHSNITGQNYNPNRLTIVNGEVVYRTLQYRAGHPVPLDVANQYRAMHLAPVPVPLPVQVPGQSLLWRIGSKLWNGVTMPIKGAYNLASRLTQGSSKLLSMFVAGGSGALTVLRLMAFFNVLRDLYGDLYATNWLTSVIDAVELLWAGETTCMSGAFSLGAGSNLLN